MSAVLIRFGIVVAELASCILLIFMAYTIFVYAPVKLFAEAECLRSGYPKARVTVGLERYCTTLDGAVTVRVEKAK